MDNGATFMNMTEVCQYLGIVRQTVSRYVANGRLKAYKVGKTYRFQPEDLRAFLSGTDSIDSATEAELRAERRQLTQRIRKRKDEIAHLGVRISAITKRIKEKAGTSAKKPKGTL